MMSDMRSRLTMYLANSIYVTDYPITYGGCDFRTDNPNLFIVFQITVSGLRQLALKQAAGNDGS
jgi:hypothetical protein